MSNSEFDKDYKELKKQLKNLALVSVLRLLYSFWLDCPTKTKWAIGRWWVIWSIIVLLDNPTTNYLAVPFFLWGFRKPIVINNSGNSIPSIFQGLKELFSFKSYTSIIWVALIVLMLIMFITQALGIA